MRTHQILRSLVAAAAIVAASTSRAAAQEDVANASGFQAGRDYFSQAPFEFHDPLTGNLLLQFTDLVLPGNAGRDLRFERTYSLKGPYPWSFGVAGMIMEIPDPWSVGQYSTLPTLWEWARGSSHQTLLLNQPASWNDVAAYQWVVTDDFMKYDRAAHRLYGPDGSISEFDWGSGTNNYHRYLTAYQDPFGNRVTFSGWGTSTLTVTQSLGNGQQRTVTLQQAGTWGTGSPGLPTAMSYAGSTWSYEIAGNYWMARATSPVGTAWQYERAGDWTWVRATTPNGGTIQYDFAWQYTGDDYICDENGCTPYPTSSIVLTDKTLGGRDQPAGNWHYEYQLDQSQWLEVRGLSHQSVVTGPTGQPDETKTTYVYGCLPVLGCADQSFYSDNGFGLGFSPGRLALLTSRTLESPVGTVLETESRTYQAIGVRGTYWCYCTPSPIGLPELSTRTIVRKGVGGAPDRSYQTIYTYRSSNFGDYHHPWTIAEAGDLSRTTTRTYEHHDNLPPAPYIVGLPSNETVASNGESFTKSWEYASTTGFMTRETLYGIITDFAPDTCGTSSGSCGNVASVTHNGHTTSATYSYGMAKNTTLPNGDLITREIDGNSTNGRPVVTKETRAGRATTFQYDALFRQTQVQPPGGASLSAPINTAYNKDANNFDVSVTITRGSTPLQSQVTTALDGMGRPRCVVNSRNVQTCTSYDADGHTVSESLTGDGAPGPSTTFSYDGLGRVVKKTNPDATDVQYTYGAVSNPGALTVAIRDENAHVTTQVLQGFGNPSGDMRLARVIDALANTWSYAYNALGNLTCVAVPSGTACDQGGFRRWTYDGSNRLVTETHPESGTDTYAYVPGTGLVATKTDANQTVSTYAYDTNDRVTSVASHMAAWPQGVSRTTGFTYEAGSDRRQTASVSDSHDGSSTQTLFTYDPATGRLTQRRDIVNNTAVFDRNFIYNPLDQVVALTYPSGRTVGYAYDSEGRITRVCRKDDAQGSCISGSDYASGFTYHPSGAPLQYTGANGLTHKFDFHPTRSWLQSIRACTPSEDCTPAGTPRLKIDTTYDGTVGQVAMIEDHSASRGNSWKQTFTYDGLDRLVTTTGNGVYPSSCFAYDARGNRTSACGTTYGYTSERLTSQSGVMFTYDANGNLLTQSSPSQTYSYTPDNLIATVSNGVSYRYDADGWRVLATGPSTATYSSRGLNGELLSQTAGSVVRDYIYAGRRLVAWADNAGAVFDITTDAIGTVRLVTNASQAIVERHDFLPFGEEWQASSSMSPVKFAGKERDAVSGFDYFGARYYQSVTRRFTTPDIPGVDQDPLDPQSWNLYNYVRNNPLRLIDPTGLKCENGYDAEKGVFCTETIGTDPDRRANDAWLAAQQFFLDSLFNYVLTPRVVNFSAGLGDALLVGTGPYFRRQLDIDVVDRCSTAYKVGAWSSFAVGGARVGYAGLAKGGSILASSGVEASAFRQGLKSAASLGLTSSWRQPNLAKYATDEALRAAAGRTNPFVNAWGVGTAAAGAAGAQACRQ